MISIGMQIVILIRLNNCLINTYVYNFLNGQTLEEVDRFKCLGSKDGASVKVVKIRLARAHSAMASLAMLWWKPSGRGKT